MEPRKNYDAIFSAIDLYWLKSKRPSPVWIAAAAAGWKNEEIRQRATDLEAACELPYLVICQTLPR